MTKALSSAFVLDVTITHEHMNLAASKNADSARTPSQQAQQQQKQQQQQQKQLDRKVRKLSIPDRPTPDLASTTPYPSSLGVVTGQVFATLAAALPNLKILVVNGCCWDFGLHAFGSHCPDLARLNVNVPDMSVAALHDLGTHLPNLIMVELDGEELGPENRVQLGRYMDAFLLTIRQCKNLHTLTCDFGTSVELACKPESWGNVPADLTHMRITCAVTLSDPYHALVQRIPSLCLWRLPHTELLRVADLYPLLQRLQYMRNLLVILGCVGAITGDCSASGTGTGTGTGTEDGAADEEGDEEDDDDIGGRGESTMAVAVGGEANGWPC
ncbi:MAG: hypothetical protein WDW38_006229 [Sanguina aurantia]